MRSMSLRGRLQQVLTSWRRKQCRYRSLNMITLNKAHALHNVRLLRGQHSGFHIIPVLKANAYGHGLREMARILNDTDCDLLAVDGYFEAGRIRFISNHRLLVLGYILPENVPLLDTQRCSFVVQDLDVLAAFGRLHRPVKIHLEINTGMNRLGIDPSELTVYLTALQKYPWLTLEGVMTHLADADNESDDRYTTKQVRLFNECVRRVMHAGFSPKYVHIAQTAGSAKVQSQYANAIRLGIGLYGINPLSKQDAAHSILAGLRPVLSLTSTIVKIIDLQKGDQVSYGGTFTAPKAMRIGVLPLGYYEGVPRALGNKGFVMHGKTRLPIVGRVCMNHTMVDLGDVAVSVGDAVVVFADDARQPNGIAHVSETFGLFPYEVITKLSSSIRRIVA